MPGKVFLPSIAKKKKLSECVTYVLKREVRKKDKKHSCLRFKESYCKVSIQQIRTLKTFLYFTFLAKIHKNRPNYTSL